MKNSKRVKICILFGELSSSWNSLAHQSASQDLAQERQMLRRIQAQRQGQIKERMVLRSNFTKGINMSKEKNRFLRSKRGSARETQKGRGNTAFTGEAMPRFCELHKSPGNGVQILWFWSHWQDHPYSNIRSCFIQPSG